MRITKEQALQFGISYMKCVESFVKDASEHKATMLKNMQQHEFVSKHDFEQFAKESFLYNMKVFYDHFSDLENAIKFTKNLLNGDE